MAIEIIVIPMKTLGRARLLAIQIIEISMKSLGKAKLVATKLNSRLLLWVEVSCDI